MLDTPGFGDPELLPQTIINQLDKKLGENKKIDVTFLLLKVNDYRNSLELGMTLSFIHEFIEGIDSDNTVLVFTHCD